MQRSLALLPSLLLVTACMQITTDNEQGASSSSAMQNISSSAGSDAAAVIPVDATWNRYVNTRLGLSLLVPKEVQIPLFSPRPVSEVTGFDVPGDTRVFLAPRIAGSGPADETIMTTLDLLESGEPSAPPHWEITVREIANDAELDALIRDRYGADCSAGERVATQQDGTFSVRIAGTGSPEEGDCFVNYVTAIKYSPSRRKAAVWNIGQAPSFLGLRADGDPDALPPVYDAEMEKSFRFE